MRFKIKAFAKIIHYGTKQRHLCNSLYQTKDKIDIIKLTLKNPQGVPQFESRIKKLSKVIIR